MSLVSGPAHGWETQGLYLLRRNLHLEGEPPDRVEAIVTAMAETWALGKAGAPYVEAIRPLEPFAEQPLLKSIAWAPPSREVYERIFLGASLDVDASAVLKHVTCPVLGLFGELDSQVDWQESVAAYRAVLAGRDLTIRTFPGADHCLLRSRTGSMNEMGRHWAEGTATPVDGCIDAILTWLGGRGFARMEGVVVQGA